MKHLNFLTSSGTPGWGSTQLKTSLRVGKDSLLTSLRSILLIFAVILGVGNAWGVDFELYSGSITEGDYLIVYDNAAMNTTVDADRLQYEDVSPNNNVISTTSTAIVWHIAPSGNYWTIYNAAANKYAASTGAKNKAQMLASGTDDMSLWTVSGTSTYEFVNKKNTANNVNKNLRKNGSYGFACYATSTGGALSLYKLKNSTPATPYTVTLMDDQAHPLTEESAGDGVELPERAGCEGYTFIGWTASWTEEQDEWTITAPEIIEVGDYVPSADINLYPVYKKIVEGGSSTSTFTSNAQGYSNDTQASAKTVQNVTYTWGSGAKYFTSGSSVRMYADNTLTISSSNSITQVDFTYSQGAFSTSGTVTTGSMTSSSQWQGSAKSIKFTNSTGSQVRISQIVVTYIGGSTTYYISVPNCCTPLGSINGSFSQNQQKVTWGAVTDASGYKVKVENASHQTVTDWTNINNTTEYSTAGLTCGGNTYYVYVKAYNNDNAGHCTGDGPSSDAIQVTSAACTEPAITVDPNALTGLNYIVNAGPSAAQSFNVKGSNLTGDLTVKANDNYEICLSNSATAADWKSGAATLTIAEATAESQNGQNVYVRLKSEKTVGDYNSNTIKVYGGGVLEANAATVTVSGSVLKPTIVADPTSISDWSTQTGSAPNPETKTITVTGSNLKADISATLTAGSDYFTITPSDLTQSAGSVNGSVVIGVKDAAYASAATRQGTLRLSTTDGDNVDVTISLTVADDPREKFTLLTSGNLSEIGEGTRMVLVYEGLLDKYAAKTGYVSSNGYNEVEEDAATEFEISGNNLYAAEGNHLLILTLGEMTGGFSLYDGNKYLSNGTSNKIGNSNDAVAWTIAVDEGDAIITCTTGQQQLIKYNTNVTDAYFRAYAASAGNTAYVKAYFKASTTPNVNISGTLEAFNYVRDNGPSAAQSFKVRGNNLSENLVVTAPENYEVCETVDGTYTASVEFTPSEGKVAETDVYIRLKAGLAVSDSYADNITVSSTGATDATLAVAGSVTTPVYTVTLHTNGGTITEGHEVESYTEGVGATLPTADYISKDGSTFNGWFDNEDLTGSAVTTIATSATGAKEYWAGWTELPGYDVVWYVDGVSYTEGDPTTHVVYNGSISKLPNAPTSLDITSKTFVGWTTSPVTEKQDAAPTPLYTAADQIPGNILEDKNFYAVFAQEEHSGTFTKVTDATTLAAGDRLLIYASNYAAGTLGSNAYLSRESVTMQSTTITNKGNAAVWVLGGTSDNWTFTSAEGTLKCYGTSNNNLSMSTGTATWKIVINSGNASITNTQHTARYIKYHGNNSRFSSYASNTEGSSLPQLYREGTSLTDYTTKFVKPVSVTSVSLNKDATTLAIGANETLTATVAPANATNKNVSWSSNATGVATVAAGVVTAVAAGEATITVTTEDGSFTDECVVTVLPTVETPTFSPAAGAINKGSKVEISCGTADATILYSIDGSDPSLAYPEGGVTINANCTLKAKATKDNYTASAEATTAYTIIKASQTVSFTESAYAFRLNSDEYNAFTGQVASSTYDGASITYTSNNTSVATVNESTGAVELQGVKGTATITATAAEDDDYNSAQATYTITVLRAGVTRTGDFVLVTDASQLADGDYILLASSASDGTAYVFANTTSSSSYQTKTVANGEITYAQLLTEGNTAKIITVEKGDDYFAFNFGTDADLYLSAAGSTTSAHDLSSSSTISNTEKWSVSIAATTYKATVANLGNASYGLIQCNNSNHQFKSYSNNSTAGTLYIYKQKDKNKLPQTLSFETESYVFPLNESGYTSFTHQAVSGAHSDVTYTSNNTDVAAIVNNAVVLQGGVGTATITATAAEDDDYEHASATYTITVTAALNTVTFHYYKASDAIADQTALKEASSGAGITVPSNPANVGEYTFLGWAPATLVETQTAPNNLVAALQAGATYHPATSEEYYAIYRRLENSDGRFYLMHEVNSTPNYAKAPVGDEFGNTTDITLAAKFVQTEDNKLYYYNGSTPTYIAGTHQGSGADGRALDFTTNEAEALVWTITESGQTVSYYDGNTEKYFAHNNTMWAAYASASINQDNQSKDLTKVYLAHVYYSSTPNLMVSPVLTWAQGNATHVMEIEDTYDNAATATVGGEPVSVTYTSSDPTKATVSAVGVVTAILGGDVTITATVAENPGVSRQLVETYQVSITKKVPQITFDNEANWNVYVGEAYKRVLAGQVTITTDGAVTYTLSNNATSSDWASINSETGEVTGLSTSSQSSKYQYLYVHTAETDMYQPGEASKQFNVLALKSQTLTFGENAYVFDFNESVDVFTNTLSGAMTGVTYGSDNTDVAVVDAESGEVTVHTDVCGVATITATAAEGYNGTDVYKEATQTYTITVNYPMPTFSMENNSEIKAPISLEISGYDAETKLYWTDGEEDPATLYDAPIAISENKTIRAKATNADGSLVSEIASVHITKITPTVNGAQDGGTITLSADENSLITYSIKNQNNVTVAEGTDVASPVVYETELSGTYTVSASAKWDVENGFTGEDYDHDFTVKGKGHLPISYEGDGGGLADEAWASVEGSLGNYSTSPKIQFDGSNDALIAAFVEKPVRLSYDIKYNGSDWSNNVYKVQWSADGESYTDIKVYNSDIVLGTTKTTENFDLDPSVRYIKWVYTTKSSGNVALGNIQITCEDVVIDGVSVIDIPEGYTGDVVVEEGVTWVPVNNDLEPTVNNLWVKQGAVVDLNLATLAVNDLKIEAQEGYSGQILEQSNFSITGQAYYDLTLNTSGTMDNTKWYAFAVPFQVDAATGIQRLSNDGVTSPAGFNSHYVLLKYNSSNRASTGEGWEYVTAGETLDPGKFYMIALNSNVYNRVRMTKKTGASVNNMANLTLSMYSAADSKNANWNAIANNALAYANVSATGANAGEGKKVQVYNSASNNYTALGFGEVTFTVGTPFFFQAEEAGTMSVNIAASNNETVKAPAREAEATEEFQIRLGEDTESYYDILYVSASEEAMNEYQIGHDLAKVGVSTVVPQMYVPAYGAKLCDAEFPMVNMQASFPLTLTAPQAGTYKMYIAQEASDAALYLTYEGAIIWDLTMGAYEIDLNQGTTEGYGLILKANAPAVSTGVDEIDAEAGAQKIFIDEHVYILRGEKMYDVTGKMVK